MQCFIDVFMICIFQLKKLQEKLKKCQADVEATHDKYNACLNDLNGYNAKYIEDMNEVSIMYSALPFLL